MLSRNGLIVLGLAAVSSLALTVVPSHAYHSRVNFSDEIVAFQATVTRFEWANPHVDEVLVVDTAGFEEHRWGNGRGIPSGPQRHSVERYTLSDDGTTVTIDYLIEDPEYLTEPVSGTINWRHAPHLALLPYDCDPAVSRRFVAED